MRLVIELAGRFLSVDAGRLIDDAEECEEIEAESEPETIRLPLGFQAPPPPVEAIEDDEEYETPEVDCL